MMLVNNIFVSVLTMFEQGCRFVLNDPDGLYEYWSDNIPELLQVSQEKGIRGCIYRLNVTEVYDRDDKLIDQYHEYEVVRTEVM
jgi:hypothetical protein